jgi:sugar-specific transcriptional regulator TrmB
MIEELRKLGLTEYESKAYCALLRCGVLDGKEASRHSLVPYSAMHFVLQQLVHKKFALMISKKPMRFKAIRPETALGGLVKEKAAELSELKDEAVESLSKLESVPLHGEEEKVEISAGKEQRFANAVQLTNDVKKEKLIISMADVMPIALQKATAGIVKRGGKVKMIATMANEENKGLLEKFKRLGFGVRHYAPLYGFSIVVYDRKVSLIVVMDPKTRETAYNIVLNSRELSEAFAEYFDFIWKKAKPV